MANQINLKNLVRALRLPFVTASVLPFLAGSFAAKGNFNILNFLLGLIAAVATHLGANLINDYADSKSGADWQDKSFYGFFGGSKLIQENILTERFYLFASMACFLISSLAVVALAVTLKSALVVAYYSIILFFGWSYSQKPLQLCYRGFGEIVIFALFGPALVMGGYFIQTGVFPDIRSLMLSAPFGFMITAILFANEVPDFSGDQKAKKFTWVSLCKPANSYFIYIILEACAFVLIVINVIAGFINPISLAALILIAPCAKAAKILKNSYSDKIKLIESSKLTILIQNIAGIILILGSIL